MERIGEASGDSDDWDVFQTGPSEMTEHHEIERAYERCFAGNDGALVLRHLRQTILDRRLGPGASDAELRFLEGQRSVAAHILAMVERGGG